MGIPDYGFKDLEATGVNMPFTIGSTIEDVVKKSCDILHVPNIGSIKIKTFVPVGDGKVPVML